MSFYYYYCALCSLELLWLCCASPTWGVQVRMLLVDLVTDRKLLTVDLISLGRRGGGDREWANNFFQFVSFVMSASCVQLLDVLYWRKVFLSHVMSHGGLPVSYTEMHLMWTWFDQFGLPSLDTLSQR